MVTKNAKNAYVSSFLKIAQFCMFVSTKSYQKLAGRQSHKNTNNSEVCSHKKCQNFLGQQFCKNTMNSQVYRHKKLPKTRSSAFIQNTKNSHIRCSTKLPQTCRSAVKKMAKNTRRSTVPKKSLKFFAQQLRKYNSNSQVRRHQKVSKSRWSAVTRKY